ncbi:type III secretion system export apparatus subunit SctT [Pseudomonas sp. NPDC090202]|uniref:type III secretion system export apparatus subunit SctT n=1 Tax=unclassified Pseudomonas TaxID=196821 RepID=UPI0037F245BD
MTGAPFLLFFDLHAWLATAALGFARLAPVFFMLPFFNNGVLTGPTRVAVIILISMSLWPVSDAAWPALDSVAMLGLILQEALIGLVIGGLLCWPIWVMQGLGSLIDNQRGATLGNTIDPANGVDTSELSNFLQWFAAAVFLEAGGMQVVVETFSTSYQLCPPQTGCELALEPVLRWLDPLLGKVLVISAPVVVTLLLSEALLGLLGRFAPQMNAFSVSLTIKSAIALLVLLLYFGSHLPDEVVRMGGAAQSNIGQWLQPSMDH